MHVHGLAIAIVPNLSEIKPLATYRSRGEASMPA